VTGGLRDLRRLGGLRRIVDQDRAGKALADMRGAAEVLRLVIDDSADIAEDRGLLAWWKPIEKRRIALPARNAPMVTTARFAGASCAIRSSGSPSRWRSRPPIL